MKCPLLSVAFLAAGLSFGSGSPAFAAAHSAAPATPAAAAAAAAAAAGGGSPAETVSIPGPLRSFLRMAAVSQEVPPDNVLPLLSRTVSLYGYQLGGETEFLHLLTRYVQFARELQTFADSQGAIHVEGCADAARLVQVLGYRFQRTCGQKDAWLITDNPDRAFLTIDSGFPLTALEEAMQNHAPFAYSFPATQVPVLFNEKAWTGLDPRDRQAGPNLIDELLHDQNLDRLYWAFSKDDGETRDTLLRAPGLRALLPIAPALDFYSSQITIHDGRILLPGGPDSDHDWQDLVGVTPNSGGEFTRRLLIKDRGWLAAYFDALSRVSSAQQVHLLHGPRLRRLYDVYRTAGAGNSATRGVFPRNADLLMLMSGLSWQPNGDMYIPGSLPAWREILTLPSSPKMVQQWVRTARTWDSSEQLLISLIACSAFDTDIGPSQIYLTLNAIDAARGSQPHLSDATVRLLAERYADFHSWYLIFSEFPQLDDGSITQFVKSAETVGSIGNSALRANAMGAFQANVGLWEILARQHQIPPEKMAASWMAVVQPFASAESSTQLFEAARGSLNALLTAAGGTSSMSQDQVINLLAGPSQTTDVGRRVRDNLSQRMHSVLDDQRLVSLDTLFGLYDGLDGMAHGTATADQLLPLAGNLRDFEMPRAIFTNSEKIAWAPGIYTSRHTELQVRTNLTKVLQSNPSAAQLEAARAELTPFLRDTLVGLNYAYYEPPGAQVLHHNPLFVRSHDFSGSSIVGYNQLWDPPTLIGIGVTAGGGAYLVGSLADLPYALASTEEDFIAPQHVQALIWRAVVPGILVGAVQPRWWSVTQQEMHATALYQRAGEELITAAAGNADLRAHVLEILTTAMAPQRLETVRAALLHANQLSDALGTITPAEKFILAAQFRIRYPAQAAASGPASTELDALVRLDPADASVERISQDFGSPHPTLEQTNACSILDMKPLPAFAGAPNRLIGESWESTNLYWARIADEMGYSPTMLNILVPELSRQMVARIFATDLEDWPALLRAMRQTGDAFRQGQIKIAAADALREPEHSAGSGQ
ncbi:MAG TPA: hypothetical protein VHX37_01350 [Acidobacteriaceae bacterium]|jgi:hypothetical protein|nr:hypothetical protein [Acidobacteriaceae bacterium]